MKAARVRRPLAVAGSAIPQCAETGWPGKWAEHNRGGEMLKRDLEAAGVPYEVDGKFADFHCLRHTVQFQVHITKMSENDRIFTRQIFNCTFQIFQRLRCNLDLVDELRRAQGARAGNSCLTTCFRSSSGIEL